jgi:aspartate racemase
MHKVGEDRRILGILGGLGPLASAYFYELLIEHTQATCDQDYIDIIMSGRATTPDRTDYILGKSNKSPVPYMVEDAKLLEQYGADAIVIPCNTAHHFIHEVRDSVSVPVPSIIEETSSFVERSKAKNVAILATEGTILSRAYQDVFDRTGVRYTIPNPEVQKSLTSIIYDDVKHGTVPSSSKLLEVVELLFEQGCDAAILGCTELSILKRGLKDDDRFIDSLEVLAHVGITLFGRQTAGFSKEFEENMSRR